MSYDTEVLADSPSLYWKLQDTSGTTATDSSGNARHGTYNGTVTTHYALNQSVSMLSSDTTLKSVAMYRNGTHTLADNDFYDGSTLNGRAYVSLAYASWNGMNVAGSAFSAECWARVPSTVTRYSTRQAQFTLCWRAASLPTQFSFRLVGRAAQPNGLRFSAAIGTGAGIQPTWTANAYNNEATEDTLVGGTPTTGYEQIHEDYVPSEYYTDGFDDLPHHYVMACGTASIRVYKDGLLSGNYYTSGVPAIPANTADLLAFGGTSSQSNGLIGYLSHCAFYLNELSAARVAAHYTAGGTKIAFLDQQWALLASQGMELTPSVSVSDTAGFIFGAQMALSPSFSASTDLIPAYRAAFTVAATANATSLTAVNQVLGVSFLASASLADTATTSKFAQMVFDNILGMSSALGLNGVMSLNLADVITAAVVIQAGDVEYNGWIVNPNLAASTGLTGFQFNSFVKHNGKYYGVGDAGIYELAGPNDNGTAIDSFVGLPKLDFGTERKKAIPYAYIGVSSSNQMVLRVIVAGETYTYTARAATNEMAEQRVDIGKGLRHTYWQFELMNTGGADFELDTIKFMPVVLERRI